MKSLGEARAKRLLGMTKGSVDAILIVNWREPFLDENFRYVTDIRGGLFEGSYALVTKSRVTVLTSILEENIARRSGCRVISYESGKELDEKLKKLLKGQDVVGVNLQGMSHWTVKNLRRQLSGARLKDVSRYLNRARMVKTADELARIAKAARIASRTADEIPEMVGVGMTEKEAAAEIDYMMRLNGADRSAFETIAAFGETTALPHYEPGNRKLKKGSVALFDFGAMFGNYRSDITRTYFTKPIDRKLARIYGVVLDAQETAIESIQPGRKARATDAAARDLIKLSGMGDFFIHSTGHGLGLLAHDPGSISSRSKDIFRENMVYTVEPGIYLPGLGGVRIEDDIAVTERGCRVLTNANKELRTI